MEEGELSYQEDHDGDLHPVEQFDRRRRENHNLEPERIKEVNAEVDRLGVKVTAQYAVLGPYDFITIVDAPDIQTMAKVSASLSSRGSIKIQTLAAIPIDQFISGLK